MSVETSSVAAPTQSSRAGLVRVRERVRVRVRVGVRVRVRVRVRTQGGLLCPVDEAAAEKESV